MNERTRQYYPASASAIARTIPSMIRDKKAIRASYIYYFSHNTSQKKHVPINLNKHIPKPAKLHDYCPKP